MPDAYHDWRRLARGVPWGASPLDGLVTGGQPTPEHLRLLAQAGVRTVVNLRPADDDLGFDEPAEVEALGMRYVNVPVTPDTLCARQFDATRGVLKDRAGWPVFLHCRSANRSGALLYPFLVLDEGRSRDEAFDLACAVGLRNAGYAEQAFAYVRVEAGKRVSG